MTVWLTFVTMALAIPGGLLLALMRLSPLRLVSGRATAFVEFFRATPLILQIYWVYYVLPAYFDMQLSQLAHRASSGSPATSRRSTPKPSAPASCRSVRANGMPGWRSAWRQRDVLSDHPAAGVMRVLPALASTWVSLFKDTSLVSIISVADLSYVSLKMRAETYRILEVLTAMAVLYWLMGYPQAKLVDWIHRRYKVVE